MKRNVSEQSRHQRAQALPFDQKRVVLFLTATHKTANTGTATNRTLPNAM